MQLHSGEPRSNTIRHCPGASCRQIELNRDISLLGERARVAFGLDAHEYNGVTKVQLMVEHAEPA